VLWSECRSTKVQAVQPQHARVKVPTKRMPCNNIVVPGGEPRYGTRLNHGNSNNGSVQVDLPEGGGLTMFSVQAIVAPFKPCVGCELHPSGCQRPNIERRQNGLGCCFAYHDDAPKPGNCDKDSMAIAIAAASSQAQTESARHCEGPSQRINLCLRPQFVSAGGDSCGH
jgi:hypothetical protein